MQFLQQHLQNNNIALSVSLQPGQEHLAVTVLFHRVKPRLPTDELQSLLSAGSSSQLVVVFMHNLPSGHEASVKPIGPDHTDPGCWQSFVQQCLLVTNTTFDETRFEWHDINQKAAMPIAKALMHSAHQPPDSRTSS
ncbi:TPA: hypothetical protein ACH3X2_010181 [Trebouxia sp. C0005]